MIWDIALFFLIVILGFGLTVVIEVGVSFLLRFRKSNEIKTVILASVLTYPILQVLISFRYSNADVYHSFSMYVIVLELFVIFAEFLILYYVFKSKHSWEYLFLISFSMNTMSYVIGLFVF